MKLKQLFVPSAIAAALLLAGCGGDINLNTGSTTTTPTPTPTPTPTLPGTFDAALSQAVTQALGTDVTVQVLSGRITQDTHLTEGAFYAISGPLFVGNDNADSATLTIDPGVVIFGRSGSDYVVVSRGSKIEAEGSASKPIIMTSLQDVVGQQTGAGQWGGVVLLGNAPSNKCPADGACAIQVEGVESGAVYGGTDEAENSGTLKYVVVKYAGFEIATDNELNGVTFGGVGSGTTVDYLQVHANADDGVEFFGGNVNAKHLVLTGNQDDSIDWDQGYRGKMQHIFVQHAVDSTDANRAIEADNHGTTLDIEPQSEATISNLTIIGNNFDGEDDSEGVYLREGTKAKLYNMVVTGPSEMGECFEVEGSTETQANLQDGGIVVQNSVMACSNGENFKNGSDDVDLANWWTNVQTDNQVLDSAMIDSSGVPVSGSPLIGNGQNVANTVDGFFDSVTHIGAFDGSVDWRQGWAFGFGGGVVTAEAPTDSGCPTGTSTISAIGGKVTCEVTGRLTADLTLTSDKFWAIKGAVFVGNDNADSATLTVQAGTTVFGRDGSDYIVVSRGSKIMAEGTASAPITFTSSADVTGGTTGAGQWGGLVLLGNAQNNKCPATGDCAIQVEGVESGAVYGGSQNDDNSGVLRYVVVKHAGFEIATDNELNGITFGSVGAGTTVEYIQVHENADDGVEFFGGTVNAKYLVLTHNQDDSIDWDQGYQGKIQHVIIKHSPDNTDANRAIEADNHGTTLDIQPQSNATVANVTVIGNTFDGEDDSEGVYLREGTNAKLYNFVITGPDGMGECLEVEGSDVTQANLNNGGIVMTNSVIACENSENFKFGSDDVNLETWFTAQDGNAVANGQSDVVNGIFTIFSGTAKDFSGDSFFDNVDYIGGVSASNNWTSGWAVGLDD